MMRAWSAPLHHVAREIHRLDHDRHTTTTLDIDERMGRPGPKSRDIHCLWRQLSSSTRPDTWQSMHQDMHVHASEAKAVFVDTRVGGSLGQGPPRVLHTVTSDSIELTKLFGPTPCRVYGEGMDVLREWKTISGFTNHFSRLQVATKLHYQQGATSCEHPHQHWQITFVWRRSSTALGPSEKTRVSAPRPTTLLTTFC